jgi:glycosyltransferase involved in cell wall biosynthesis
MHLLVIALGFPAPGNPLPGVFIGEQVRLLCERVERITVLSPTIFVPAFMRGFRRVANRVSLPDRYQMVEGRCEVLFPRYVHVPGNILLRWTTAQWCRIVEQTVARFTTTCPVSIIHAHFGSVTSWAAVCAAKRYHIPCVVTYQGTDVHTILAHRHKGWQLCRDSFRLADLNLPVSRSLESILRLHAQPTGRCEVLLRGVDQTRFFPSSKLSADPCVLFVGNIVKTKGVFDLLSAWAKVKRAYPNASLTMVGSDYTKGLFSRAMLSLGVDSSVTLTGPLPLPAVANLMRRSRLLCLPSHGEGTPNCVMEALSCGLPVVATRVGGIPDIVEHDKTGLLIDKGDVEGLATSLVTLLRDPSRCARMGQAAHAFARAQLDARKTINRLVELYDELIVKHSRERSPIPHRYAEGTRFEE